MMGIFIHVYILIMNFLSVSLLYSIWEMRIKLNWYTHACIIKIYSQYNASILVNVHISELL